METYKHEFVKVFTRKPFRQFIIDSMMENKTMA
jgi:hypothetical protein